MNKKGPWPKREQLSVAEQIKLLGRHWRGHPSYVPTEAHLHPASYYMEQARKEAFEKRTFRHLLRKRKC